MRRHIERLNHLIRDEISELLRRQVKDPRLGGFITVTRVSTSPDLRHAKIFISIMGNEDEKRECLKGLAAASGFLRRELSLRLTLRRTPELSFHYDDSIEQGTHVLQLITQVANEAGEKGKSGC
jgi:ribosome-binding factor A